jgi:hypothetical protein
VLRVATQRRSPGGAEAFRRALSHPDPEIRRVGLRVMGERGPFVIPREALARIAESDADAETRRQAERTLQKLYD